LDAMKISISIFDHQVISHVISIRHEHASKLLFSGARFSGAREAEEREGVLLSRGGIA
jgi:hypothetical protein